MKNLLKLENGKFVVEKRSIFGEEYLDNQSFYWWSKPYVKKHCYFDSAELAEKHYLEYKKKTEKFSEEIKGEKIKELL
jgi:hypothetical protein